MKKTILASLLAISLNATAQPFYAESRILVEPKAGTSVVAFQNLLKSHSAVPRLRVGNTNIYRVYVEKGDEISAVQRLRQNPLVKFAEVDAKVPPTYTVNDPLVSNQWYLNNIKALGAWPYATGTNVVVAVADTGVNINHPDLVGKTLPGWNTDSNNTDITDIHGHGTTVAGAPTAYINNSVGISGIAGNSLLLPIKITNSSDGWAYFSNMAEAITYAADKGAKVVNLSYDGSASSSVASAAAYLNSKNGLLFVSAGNSGTDPGYTNNLNIIAVSATDSNNNKASWSSYGAYVDIAAPGVSIYTTDKSGGYSYHSGTSFASPVAAGVAALVYSANPSLTYKDVEYILKSTATPLNNSSFYGAGLINAEAAVAGAFNVPKDTIPPTVSISSTSTISGNATININATDNVQVSKVELYINNSLYATDLSTPFSFIVDSTKYTSGTYISVYAKAYDPSTNTSTSNTLTLLVNNVTKGGKGRPKSR